MYLAIRILLDPSCTAHLVAYQCIITSGNSHHPLLAWVSYDTKFRAKAANDPSLRWDIRDLDLWFEYFPGTSNQPNCWPCLHCCSTTHYPSTVIVSFAPLIHSLEENNQFLLITNNEPTSLKPLHAVISIDPAITEKILNFHTNVISVPGPTQPRTASKRGSSSLINPPP